MIQTLTKQETEKVKEYAEWLREGNDKLNFRQPIKSYYSNSEDELLWFEIYEGILSTQLNGTDRDKITCTQSHNCDKYDHIEYFKPIAESIYRKYILEKICGDLFNG